MEAKDCLADNGNGKKWNKVMIRNRAIYYVEDGCGCRVIFNYSK